MLSHRLQDESRHRRVDHLERGCQLFSTKVRIFHKFESESKSAEEILVASLRVLGVSIKLRDAQCKCSTPQYNKKATQFSRSLDPSKQACLPCQRLTGIKTFTFTQTNLVVHTSLYQSIPLIFTFHPVFSGKVKVDKTKFCKK